MCPHLHQVVVRSIQVLIQLNHQALKEGGELPLLFTWLRNVGGVGDNCVTCKHQSYTQLL